MWDKAETLGIKRQKHMIDILIGLTRSSILSLFSVKKFDREILDEDIKK